MVDNTLTIDLEVSNTEEAHEALSELEDHIRRVREEVQALNEELERAGDLADGGPYARERVGDQEVAFFGEDSARLLEE